MANIDYILYEKYTPKMTAENSWATATPLNGGLYLVKEGVIFCPNNTFLAAYTNLMSLKDKNVTVFAYDEISKAETGSYKHLWKTIYTLRVHTKSGETHFFMMANKQKADNWTAEINRRIN